MGNSIYISSKPFFVTRYLFLTFDRLRQRCPTLSPLATCGDRRFKCGDRQVFINVSLMINTLRFPKILTVANVATERPWLDTTGLRIRKDTMNVIKNATTISDFLGNLCLHSLTTHQLRITITTDNIKGR
jgi:hypothetical protein